MQELKDQQKRIENKLDILIAAMSVHPEFGNLVKEGKRNLYKAEKTEELQKRIREWDNAKFTCAASFLETSMGMSSGVYYRLRAIYDNHIFGRRSHTEISELQREELLRSIEDREGNQDLASYIDRGIGPRPNMEEELKLIMEEYDRKQETSTENV